ncbi:MAG: 1-(5-phosphoribosyl)-5-[(5-phosphoribosylamino)methylideneamino]imidazole-4-carboxamide isomerase [Candidatus Omnitrophica bacterium]|nr:1-(5-phosphoribosyl)-5-[(5-phosphoribosylamino)methylideneamino]imidazole-4-carboxamide isomerase [Candidatus Omnitrophota bacterium]
MQIIPALDIRKGNCVRLMQGRASEEIVYSRDPLAMAMRWEREGAKRLHVVDLDAAFCGRPVNKKLIATIARKLSIPIQVGGGIRTVAHIQYYLKNGVDRVILGTKALLDRKFLSVIPRLDRGIHVFIALDTKNGKVAFHGWKRVSSISAISMARELDKMGVAGIIYTDISRDCMLTGPNTKFMLRLLKEVTLPIIISGGISRVSDISKIKKLSPNRVSGVIIGQALYTGKIKLKDAINI